MNKAILVAISTLLIIQLSNIMHETDAIPLFPSYVLAVNDLEFNIMYYSHAGNTRISLIELDEESNSLLVTLDKTEQKEDVFDLYLPHYLIESKINGTDTAFDVLVDGVAAIADERSNEIHRYLTIPLGKHASTLKIIGTETLSITYDTTTLSIKHCCFWASTDKTVYFPGEEMIVQGSVAKKLPVGEATIHIIRNNTVTPLFFIPEENINDEGFFSYSLGSAETLQPGEYSLRMTYGYLSTKTSFTILESSKFSADVDAIRTTPFTISFDEQDFTKSARVHQILILKPNESKTLHIKVHNNDQGTHIISLGISMLNVYVPFTHSFEPGRMMVSPNATKEVLLHIKAGNTNQTHGSYIPILAQSNVFGATAKQFALFLGNNVTDNDMDWIDVSIRESLPGAVFPYLDTKITEQEAEDILENKFATPKYFGTPRYLPENYKFMGSAIGSPEAGLVYAPVEITNKIEERDFWKSGGLLVFYGDIGPNVNLNELIPDYIAFNEGQMVNINGIMGTAVEQKQRITSEGYKFKFPAELVLYTDYSLVELRGNMPLNELLKVAASIPLQEIKHIPIIISELELNSSGYDSLDLETFECQGLKLTSKQWIEIHNASDRTIELKDIGIELNQGQTMQNALFQTQPLKPGEYRFVGLASSQLIFPTNKSFALVRFGDERLRIDSTPVLNDTMPTYKTWQKVNGQWVFWDATPCNELLGKKLDVNAEGRDFVISVIGTTNIDLIEFNKESKSIVLLADTDRIQNINITLEKALIGGPYSLSMQKEKGIRGTWEVNQNDTHASFFVNLPEGETTITITGTTVIQEFPMLHLTKSTPSGTILVDLYWKPDIIEANKTATFVLAFRDKENNLIKDTRYDLLITDAKGNVVLNKKFLATVDGKGTNEVIFDSTGNAHLMVTYHYALGTGFLAEPVDEKVEFDLMVVPEFPVNLMAITAIGLIGALIALRVKVKELVTS